MVENSIEIDYKRYLWDWFIYENEELHRKKEIRILSCEQICGRHIRLVGYDENILQKMQQLKEKNPSKCQILSGKNIFIRGPNSNDITINQSGKSPWYLIRAISLFTFIISPLY